MHAHLKYCRHSVSEAEMARHWSYATRSCDCDESFLRLLINSLSRPICLGFVRTYQRAAHVKRFQVSAAAQRYSMLEREVSVIA